MADTQTAGALSRMLEMELRPEPGRGLPSSGGGESKEKLQEDHLPERKLPTEEIPTKKIPWERARMLATTRRKRISEFAVGGFVAALPGATQSIADYFATNPHVLPSGGHFIEIGLAIVFGTLTAASILHFSEPTSADVLAKTFPEMVEQERFVRRVRRWWGKIKDDFKAPL
jgi:hypothetical protein